MLKVVHKCRPFKLMFNLPTLFVYKDDYLDIHVKDLKPDERNEESGVGPYAMDNVADDDGNQREKEFNDKVNGQNINASHDRATMERSKEDESLGTNINEEVGQTVADNVTVLNEDATEDNNITTEMANIEKEFRRKMFLFPILATITFAVIFIVVWCWCWCCGKSKNVGKVATNTSNVYKYLVVKTQDKERELLKQ
uniref:Transmembrane protein n=1 Tax=Steinernema glaseri TaxID=37863 RepID=A0A1I7YYP9_9BILA